MEEIIKTEEEAHINPMLAMRVNPDSELKKYLVEYVGTKLENEEVTVNMIAEVLAVDFPEFVFPKINKISPSSFIAAARRLNLRRNLSVNSFLSNFIKS